MKSSQVFQNLSIQSQKHIKHTPKIPRGEFEKIIITFCSFLFGFIIFVKEPST